MNTRLKKLEKKIGGVLGEFRENFKNFHIELHTLIEYTGFLLFLRYIIEVRCRGPLTAKLYSSIWLSV
ncbi:MAG: hypothetical protein ACTSPQ_15670 [Candidatus Helarchaeota archaeon]